MRVVEPVPVDATGPGSCARTVAEPEAVLTIEPRVPVAVS
ncbi:hypothetical protein GA0074694_3534 [Micromonospora inyonensis]|uniref:Uncharacterized protein n=1 Tax=Micromonospora inyonensis TaxID=47866 RepID=A0A1C6S0R3_9ACTN|nr:hypothetical protein GA0074694_3534 [Micromonospora inyonensis]